MPKLFVSIADHYTWKDLIEVNLLMSNIEFIELENITWQ